jgi:D-xylulose reductase
MCIVSPVYSQHALIPERERLFRHPHAIVYNTGSMGLVHCLSPMCLGHESAGILVRLGANVAAQAAAADQVSSQANGDDKATTAVVGKRVLRLGDEVALEPGATCRMCRDCRSGQYQVRFRSYTGTQRNVLMVGCIQICEHMAFAAYPPFDGTLQRYYKL